jgi:hypothetical protein
MLSIILGAVVFIFMLLFLWKYAESSYYQSELEAVKEKFKKYLPILECAENRGWWSTPVGAEITGGSCYSRK